MMKRFTVLPLVGPDDSCYRGAMQLTPFRFAVLLGLVLVAAVFSGWIVFVEGSGYYR